MSGFSMFDIDDVIERDLSFLEKYNLQCVTPDTMDAAFNDLERADILSLDTETSGLSPFPIHTDLVGVVLSPDVKTSYYFPLAHKIGNNLNLSDFIFRFKKLCETKKFILFNAKFDYKQIFAHWDIDFDIYSDVQVLAYLLDANLAESRNLSLKYLTRKYLNIETLELKEFGTTNFSFLDPSEAYKYACMDTITTYLLYNLFMPQISQKQLDTVYRIEMDIIKPVAIMELNGVTIDASILKKQEDDMLARANELEQTIYQLAGREFDINSPKQLSTILFDELKIKPPYVRGAEVRATGAENLEMIQDEHPIVGAIIAYREVTKLYRDFVVKLPTCMAEDGKLHSELMTMGTRSGRCSSSGGFGKGGVDIKLNLQQLPKSKGYEIELNAHIPPDMESKIDFNKVYSEKEISSIYPDYLTNKSGKPVRFTRFVKVKIRNAFVPSKGYYWLSADYSQQEYRVMASLAGEKDLIQAFIDGVDFHTATASSMLGVPVDQVTSEQRKIGKTINFGLGYGLSAGSLGKKLGKSTKEAQQLYDDYFASKKKMKELISHTKEEVLKVGHSRTFFGRIRPFEDDIAKAKQSGVSYDLESVQKRAFNTTIQGTSADLSKIALGRVWKAIQPYGDKIRMLAMIHDEIDFEVHESIPKEEAIKVIDRAMSFYNIHPSWAPIVADFEIGDSFGNLKEASELGIDLDSLLKENRENPPEFDYKPYDKWLSKLDNNLGFTKSKPTTKDSSPKPVVNSKTQESRVENRSKLTVELLEGKTFKQPTLILSVKEGVPDEIAFESLRKFISANFGKFLLILQRDSFYYKFPEEYMVSDNISSLNDTFDCHVYDVKPKFKLEL